MIPVIKIKKFNCKILEHRRLAGYPPTIAIIGKRGTGKSTLIKDILYNMNGIPMLICMSGSEEGNGFYSKFMHPLLIHTDYNKEIISNLISRQKFKLNKCVEHGIDPDTRPELGAAILLDDMNYRTDIMKKEEIR